MSRGSTSARTWSLKSRLPLFAGSFNEALVPLGSSHFNEVG